MSRRQKDPLRASSGEERAELMRLSHSQSTPATQVARATALLAVADGQSYLAAARQVQPALRTLKGNGWDNGSNGYGNYHETNDAAKRVQKQVTHKPVQDSNDIASN